ncbi:hypothetical protein AX769_17265 [Frondihabitans sp. PAMC 28766]|uniref:amidohydrolase family protein n=1 Tax=Frondihabitans sp. PAMC 28766 TaxID=1795630 RepID=UPI00078CB6F7|nr:amidohydrolase family protein [Frondihabitans sp. PAMC 28766]AMM21570.1 hypothetical protein AX769_17265 [Frondihabitans sp. PAMC 28766]
MTGYAGPLFDVQAHAIDPRGLATASSGIREVPGLSEGTKEIIVSDVLATAADDLTGARRIAALEGGTRQIVSITLDFPDLPPEQLVGMADRTNTWLAGRVADHPQLLGVASIAPPPALVRAGTAPDGQLWSDKGVGAMRRAIDELGLAAVIFMSNYGGVLLGDPAFEPYFAAADELGIPVVIHPSWEPVEFSAVPRKNIPTFSGYLDDQRTTLLDIVKAGVLENHPDLTIVATHLGGGILTSLGRFEQLSLRFPDDQWYIANDGQTRNLPHPISHYLAKIHYDCNNATAVDIEHAIRVVGVEHLLSGTDFPWASDEYTRQVLGELDPAAARAIAFDNAAALFRGER